MDRFERTNLIGPQIDTLLLNDLQTIILGLL